MPVKGRLSIAVSPPHLLGNASKRRRGRNCAALAICLLIPSHVTETAKISWSFTEQLSEQIRQEEPGRLGLHAVDPEVGTAGVVLVSSIGQLETVCLRVECPAPGVHI